MKKVWLVCNSCGYNVEVLESEIYGRDICILCENKMVLDLNHGNKLEEEPTGDNFPQFDKEKQASELERLNKGLNKLGNINGFEQEITNSRNMIGDTLTWVMIEGIKDAMVRLQCRFIFIYQGGKIPEKEEK